MRSWLCVSAAVLLLACGTFSAATPRAVQEKQAHNELKLAGLRPGRDTLKTAVRLFGPRYRQVVPGSDDVLGWVDPKNRVALRLEVDGDGVIQSMSLSTIDPLLFDDRPKGNAQTTTLLSRAALATGHGLRLASSRKADVIRLYGEPSSVGTSTQHGRELELMFYAFDWAGAQVPQVMEVTCERGSGRVVQITLSFPSL